MCPPQWPSLPRALPVRAPGGRVYFRVHKGTEFVGVDDLNELETAIKFIRADVDPSVLRDFQEAVDHVRLSAWGVQTWLDEREKGHSPYPLVPILTDERIRRATQLCNQLADEVKALQLHVHGQGVEKFEELFRAIDRLHRPLAPLFKK